MAVQVEALSAPKTFYRAAQMAWHGKRILPLLATVPLFLGPVEFTCWTLRVAHTTQGLAEDWAHLRYDFELILEHWWIPYQRKNVYILVYMLGYYAATAVGFAAIIQAVSDLHTKGSTKVDVCLRAARSCWGSIFGVELLIVSTILVSWGYPVWVILMKSLDWYDQVWIAGFALYPIATIEFYLIIRMMLTFPCIVLEKTSAWQGIRRSWKLTKGAFWETAGSVVLLQAIILVLQSWLMWWFRADIKAFQIDHDSNRYVRVLIHKYLPTLLCVPVHSIFQCILYYNRRIKVEGVSLVREYEPPGFQADVLNWWQLAKALRARYSAARR